MKPSYAARYSRRARAATIATALGLTGVLLLSACTKGQGDQASEDQGTAVFVTTSDANAVAVPEVCEDWLALTPEQQQAYPSGVENFPASAAYYLSTGAGLMSGADALTAGCPGLQPATALSTVLEEASAPTCTSYLALTPDVQQTWIDTLRDHATEYALWATTMPMTVQDTVDGCTDAVAFVGDYFVTGAGLGTMNNRATWVTETELGYQTELTLYIGSPETGDAIYHPQLAADAQMPSVCDYNPQTDAAIPYTLMAFNKDAALLGIVTARFSLTSDTGLLTTPSIEARYSDQPKCLTNSNSDYSSTSTVKMATQWTPQEPDPYATEDDPSAAPSVMNTRLWAHGYIILKDWISPKRPSGATEELGQYQFEGLSSGDEPATVISHTDTTLAG